MAQTRVQTAVQITCALGGITVNKSRAIPVWQGSTFLRPATARTTPFALSVQQASPARAEQRSQWTV
jgi:hypothetical protein